MDYIAQTHQYVHTCIQHFQSFTEAVLPQSYVVPISIDLSSVLQKGYGAWATHKYNPIEDTHSLYIWEELFQKHGSDQIIFHELTHIWDAEKYAKGDKMKYFSIKGFTEYHAAQIEMMKAVGCSSIMQPRYFNMEEKISLFPSASRIIDYVHSARETATALLLRKDFPENIEALSTFLGLVFNYLGRLSICRLYSRNYPLYKEELERMEEIRTFIDPQVFDLMFRLLDGWLSDEIILVLGTGYKMICTGLINRYRLV